MTEDQEARSTVARARPIVGSSRRGIKSLLLSRRAPQPKESWPSTIHLHLVDAGVSEIVGTDDFAAVAGHQAVQDRRPYRLPEEADSPVSEQKVCSSLMMAEEPIGLR